MNKKRSAVWMNFKQSEKRDKAICNFCKKEISFSKGSTSNLSRHLKIHPGIENKPSSDSESEEPVIFDNSTNTNKVCTGNTKKATIKSFYQKTDVYRQKKIDRKLIEMIALDFQPFQIVEDRGFRDLIKIIDPYYALPNRKILSTLMLDSVYIDIKEKLKKNLDEMEFGCLTIDHWTSRANESFMAVTIHFINNGWQMCSFVLQCSPFHERHTAENICLAIKECMREYNIEENKISCIVSDNARNIVAAIKLTKILNLSCLAHTLNIIIQSGLEIIDETLKKVKKIVEHFNRSTLASEKLKQYQLNNNCNNGKPLKLKNDVITRWNSTFLMLERIIKLQEPLQAVLGILHHPVDDLNIEEWCTIKEIKNILEPFEQITTELSSEKNISISKIIILVQGCRKALAEMSYVLQTSMAQKLCNDLVSKMAEKFKGLEQNSTMAKATFLDPRFKKSGFSDLSAYKIVSDSVQRDICQILIKKKTNSIEKVQSAPSTEISTLNSSSIWKDFDLKQKQDSMLCENGGSVSSEAIIEISQFKKENNLGRTGNPLQWYSNKSSLYPNLYQIAKKILCIPATSVPSERTFSKAGLVVTDRRSRLTGSKIDKLVFLNANL